MKVYALFNLGDQEVEIHTEDEFVHLINNLKNEMQEEGYPTETVEDNEVLEFFWGDEVFMGVRDV